MRWYAHGFYITADVPEQIEKPKHLDQHADSRPLEEDEEDAAEETSSPAELIPPREEVERFLRTDDEEEAAEEEDLYVCAAPEGFDEYAPGRNGELAAHVSKSEERTVKEEHDAEHHEERAERGQPDANFCTRTQRTRVRVFFLSGDKLYILEK